MKKLLALLLAVSMAFSLCACGSDSGVSAASGNPPVSSGDTDITNTDGPDDNPSEPDTIAPITGEHQQQNPTDTTDPSTQTPDPVQTEPARPEGLILMTTTDTNLRDPKIYSVNVETGESELIAKWDFRPRQGDVIYYFTGAGFSCGHREWFTNDYSRIAVSRTDTQSGQSCAGWLDADGNFFNVSEALGQLDRGDFDDPAQYYTVGFMDDEFFVYRQIVGTGASAKSSYHYVPLDNLGASAIQDGMPFPGYDEDGLAKVTVSDYIGDSRYLINTSDGVSQVFNMATGERTSYVPGTSRFSWHATLSPDGRLVAFMSQPKNGTEIDIYTMPLAGGDPVKVSTDSFSLSYQQACENGHGYGDQVTMLVEWR